MEQVILDNMSWEELASAHTKAAGNLAAAKSAEMQLRMHICDQVLLDKIKGVAHKVIDGFDFAATAKINMSIDKELLENLLPDLSDTEKLCIRYKPEVVAKTYNALDSKSKLHLAVTAKPGTPSLKIKPIKA